MTHDSTGMDRVQSLIGNDYTLHFIIGHGGMSTVWLATDNRAGDEVAIKVLRPEFSDNNEFLSRFRNEAHSATSIVSDNVVATRDYREADDPAGHVFCFIVMEYVRGESLADMIARRGRLDEDQALDVLEQAAHGLAVIHRMRLVHRDIKPGNILVTERGVVKITDFGIAKAAESVPLTRTGMVVGTAQYVSPEQAQGRRVTAASDVYSLAVVGYELLSGHRPFGGESSVSVAIAHINETPPPLPADITPETRELIATCLSKDPQQRYADGNEMSHAISAVRFGRRPPEPRTAALARRAPEYHPTSTTRALGHATMPTTTIPSVTPPRPQVLPAPPARRGYVQPPPPQKKRGMGGWLALVIVLVVLVAAAIYFLITTVDSGRSLNPRQPIPSTPSSPPVTQTVIETVEPSTPHTSTTPPTVSFDDSPAPETPRNSEEPTPTRPSSGNEEGETSDGNDSATHATRHPNRRHTDNREHSGNHHKPAEDFSPAEGGEQ